MRRRPRRTARSRQEGGLPDKRSEPLVVKYAAHAKPFRTEQVASEIAQVSVEQHFSGKRREYQTLIAALDVAAAIVVLGACSR